MNDTQNANLILLTADAALIHLLRTAVEGRHRLWRVDEAPRAIELVQAARLGVVLVDAAVAGERVAAVVADIADTLPTVPLLVTGRREDEVTLAGQISSGRVFRFLHKPVSVERARTFIDAAIRRRLELDPASARAPELQMPAAPPVEDDTLELAGLDTPSPAPARPRRLWWPKRSSDQEKLRVSLVPALGFAVTGAIIIAAVVLQPWRQLELPVRAAAPAAPAAPAATPREIGIARLLDAAGIALAQGRLHEPPGRNALELYRSVLQLDPANHKARVGFGSTIDALAGKASDALDQGDLAAAEAALAGLRQADPLHERLAEFDERLAAAQAGRQEQLLAAQRAEPVPPPAPTPPPPPMSLAERAREAAIAENLGRALELQRLGRLAGGSDSALSYVQSAQDIAPADPRVMAAATALLLALVQKAQQATERGDYDGARRLLAYADELGVERDAVQQARTQFDSRRASTIRTEQARLLDLANQRLLQGRLIDPPADSAVHYVDLLRAANPDYPGLEDTLSVLVTRLHDEARRLQDAGETREAQRYLNAARY